MKAHLEKNTNKSNRTKVMNAIWKDKDCLMNSSKKSFKERRKNFVDKYKEFFSASYLERLLQRLEKNVLNPSLLSDVVTSTWTNNDGIFTYFVQAYS